MNTNYPIEDLPSIFRTSHPIVVFYYAYLILYEFFPFYIDYIYYIDYIGSKFNKDDVNLIIARYHENIEWALAYNDIAIIYNKGNKDIPEFINIKNINNIGREGHTYLYYIITRYNSLPNRTIFLQADWFSHNETILYGIDNYDTHLSVQPMGLVYLRKKPIPPREIELKFTILSKESFA
jgi:hypothetical protein